MLSKNMLPKVRLYHNIMWSKYKADVFSALFCEAQQREVVEFSFYQIAESEGQRAGMSKVDLTRHKYPYKLLFTGSYDDISSFSLIYKLFSSVFFSSAQLVLLPGYYRIEHWFMLLACILRRKPCAVFSDSTLRDKPFRVIPSLAKRTFLFFCDAAFTYGERGREHLLSLGVNPQKIIIRCQAAALPIGYELGNVIKNRLHSVPKGDSPQFLFVGRLSGDKGIDLMLQGFSATLSKYPLASMIIIGRGPDEAELKNIADKLGIAERVQFLGGMELNNIVSYYQKATCLILPSRKEPWGLVANEALHYGCPVIVSDNCGCVPELFYGKSAGIVFKSGCIDELSVAMIKAPMVFANVGLTAWECLNSVSNSTPDIAARQIHDGCLRLLGYKPA